MAPQIRFAHMRFKIEMYTNKYLKNITNKMLLIYLKINVVLKRKLLCILSCHFIHVLYFKDLIKITT